MARPYPQACQGATTGHALDLGTHTWEVQSNNRRTQGRGPCRCYRKQIQGLSLEEVWLLVDMPP